MSDKEKDFLDSGCCRGSLGIHKIWIFASSEQLFSRHHRKLVISMAFEILSVKQGGGVKEGRKLCRAKYVGTLKWRVSIRT